MPSVHSARVILTACAALLALALSAMSAGATSRIKDLATIEGVRQNQLIGYGLVVGLNGTGDTLNNVPFTKQSLQAMLERLGVNTRGANMRTGNVAAVMVTANLPPFATQGTRHRRHRLRARRCQDPAGRHPAGHAAARRRRRGLCGRAGLGRDRRLLGRGRGRQDHPRRADRRPHRQRRPGRARDRIRAQPAAQTLRLSLRNPDFTTAQRIAAAINDFLGGETAEPIDPSTVRAADPAALPGQHRSRC